jgi:sugar porter (SP) family MFS transporter
LKNTRKLYLYTFVAALGGLLFGFDTAVINGAIPFFSDYFQLNDTLKGWSVSAALIGCVLGALGVGRPGDYFGRRYVLKFLGLLFLASAVGTGAATQLWIFILFRLIGGLAVGGASVLSPMYISEISPPAYRGRLTVTFQLAIVTGILVAFFADYLLVGTGENNWRWMFLSEGIPALAFFILLFYVERSPRWLVKKGQVREAKRVILQVDPSAPVDITLREIQDSINQEVISGSIYLFRKPFLRLILIGIAIGMFNQFTGINVIMYYATDIFRSAGFTTGSALAQTVIIGLTNLVFTLIAMRVIDQFGRKNLLLTGSLGMTLFLGLFSWSFLAGNFRGFYLLIFLVGFIAFFAFSQGAVIWVLLAEMFPNNIRARGTAIGSFSHWFFNALTTFLFPILAGSFSGGKGTGYVFIFYTLATFLGFFFYRKYVIETRGKSLEQLEKETLVT